MRGSGFVRALAVLWVLAGAAFAVLVALAVREHLVALAIVTR